MTTDN